MAILTIQCLAISITILVSKQGLLMNSSKILIPALFLAITFAPFLVAAQEAPLLPCEELENAVLEQTPDDIVQRITAFTPAKVLDRIHPKYPPIAARIGAEGWVQMSYVIDTEGNVVDPVIEDFGGNKRFKASALRAIKRWKFDPAVKDGQPTEQCHQSVQFDFTLSGNTGATRRFITDYKEAEALFGSQDYTAADKIVQKLHNNKNNNRYENAWLWSLDAKIAEKLKQHKRETNAIKRTIASSQSHDKDKQTFDDAYIAYMHQRLFALQASFSHYALALKTLEKIKGFPNADALIVPLASIIKHIDDALASKENLFIRANLNKDGGFFHTLIRNNFGFANVNGQVDTVEVRCESRREKFTVAEDHIWNIPASWGSCQVFVKGEKDASFELVEVYKASEENDV